MLIYQTLLYLPAQLLGPAVQFLAAVAWTHWLSPSEYGVVALVIAEVVTGGSGAAKHRRPAPALPTEVLVAPRVTLASLHGRPAVINFWVVTLDMGSSLSAAYLTTIGTIRQASDSFPRSRVGPFVTAPR